MYTILLLSESKLHALLEQYLSRFTDHIQPAQESEKEWLTNKEAREYLRLSRPTLQRYRASGKLPYSRVGRNIFFRRSDLDALLEQHIQ